MRSLRPLALTATMVVVLSAFAAPVAFLSGAAAQTAPADMPMKDVALTQKQVDGAIAAQKEIRDFEAKQPNDKSDKPDPKADAKILEIIRKNGFADLNDYAGISATIGQVMAGIDADTKRYIGPGAVIKKQITEVEGDAKMPAKEKKETLDELKAALKTAASDKQSAGNIELVSKNFDALSQGIEAE